MKKEPVFTMVPYDSVVLEGDRVNCQAQVLLLFW